LEGSPSEPEEKGKRKERKRKAQVYSFHVT